MFHFIKLVLNYSVAVLCTIYNIVYYRAFNSNDVEQLNKNKELKLKLKKEKKKNPYEKSEKNAQAQICKLFLKRAYTDTHIQPVFTV